MVVYEVKYNFYSLNFYIFHQIQKFNKKITQNCIIVDKLSISLKY